MNGKMAETILRLKGNVVIRTILYPIMRVRVIFAKKKYVRDGNNEIIKTYNNIHNNERCFIIGNGPSLSVDDLEKIKDEYTIGVNRIFNIFTKTKWRPSYYLAVDEELIQSEWKNIKNIHSTKFIKNVKKTDNIEQKDIVPIFINSTTPISKYNYNKQSISENLEEGFSLNYSVVCYAIELAIYMGFKEICLIGVDHNYPKEIDATGKTKKNNVKEHFEGGSYANGTVSYYIDAVTNCFIAYKRYADAHGIKIVNVTRGGKLEVFERLSLEKILNDKN